MKKQLLILISLCLGFLLNAQPIVTTKTVNVETAGTLATLLTSEEFNSVTDLTVTGRINSSDIYSLKGMSRLVNLIMTNSTIEGNNIPTGAFSGNSRYKSISLPSSITSIGNDDFTYCNGLISITIPLSVSSIGEYAFSNCSNLAFIEVNSNNKYYSSLDGVLFNKEKTKILKCPTAKIGDYAIPSTVQSIEDLSFYRCEGLTSINIPSSVLSIGEFAFYCCNGLISVSIPSSVTSLGNYAFEGCSKLFSVNIPTSVTSIGRETFKYCSDLYSVNIPSSVTSIGKYAFQDCYRLPSVHIPSSVTTIDTSTFEGCENLFSVTIPASVTSIRSTAFAHCNNLTSVSIPSSVKLIGFGAFLGCKKLVSVSIPSSVTTIESSAFAHCDSLSEIYLYSAKPIAIDSYVFANGNSQNRIFYVPKGSKQLYSTADIWKDFRIEEMSDFIVFKKSTNIGFNGDPTTINISSSSKWYASSDQSWLTLNPSSGISNDTLTIYALPNTTGIARTATITVVSNNINKTIIAKQVTPILEAYFTAPACTSCVSVSLPFNPTDSCVGKVLSNTSWKASSNQAWLTTSSASGTGAGLLTITAATNNSGLVRTGIITISASGLSKSLTITQQYEPGIMLSANNTTIASNPDYASSFSITSNVPWVASSDQSWLTIENKSGNGNGNVRYNANENTTGIDRVATITVSSTGVSSRTITVTQLKQLLFITPEKLVKIPVYAGTTTATALINTTEKWRISPEASWLKVSPSSGTGNATVTFTVTINDASFVNNKDTGTVVTVTAKNGEKRQIAISLTSCQSSVNIPIGVTRIPNYAFGNDTSSCPELQFISIPSSVTSIDGYAFNACNKLSAITIPSSVTSIGYSAFGYCKGLTSISIPSSVTSISSNAFYEGLTSMYVYNTKPIDGTSFLSNLSKSNCVIYVPVGSKQTYMKASGWKAFRIEEMSGLIVSPSAVNLSSDASCTSSVNISSSEAWTATSNQSWLTISPSSGAGSSVLTFTATANKDANSRTATVTVASKDQSQTITILQAGFSQVSGALVVSATNVGLANAKGSSSSVSVTTTSNWTTSSSASWLTVSPSSGSGNGVISFTSATSTTTSDLTATFTIASAGQTTRYVTVTQYANKQVVAGASEVVIPSNSNTASVPISATSSWSASCDQPWVTLVIQWSNGGGTINISTLPNITKVARTATITITSNGQTQTISVTQPAGAGTSAELEGKTEEYGSIIHPNPAGNYFYVSVNTRALVRIFSMAGSLIMQQDVESGQAVDVSALPSGLYVVNIQDEHSIKVVQLVKK